MSQSKVNSLFRPRRSSRIQNSKLDVVDSVKHIALLKEANEVKKKLEVKPVSEVPCAEIKNPKGKNEIKVKAVLKSKAPKAENKTGKSAKSNRGVKASKKFSSADLSNSKITSFFDKSKDPMGCTLSSISEDTASNLVISTSLSLDKEVITNSASSESSVNIKTKCDTTSSIDNAHEKNVIEIKNSSEIICGREILRSPKRCLINPNEGTPPKKKYVILNDDDPSKQSPSKLMTPKKLFQDDEAFVNAIKKSTEKKVVVTKSDSMKKALDDFKARINLVKKFEDNSFKPTSVISSFLSPAKQEEKKSVPPTVPAYQKYSYLADPQLSKSLVLPFKYKQLAEVFKSMDTVVSILNNRKEKITFNKVKEGVQKMMKRTFSLALLGQIVKVMPHAYDVSVEKCIFKKANDPDYQYIITPKLKAAESSNKKSKGFQTFTPQDFSNRELDFNNQLLNLVQRHHQVFLDKLNFPPVSSESIKRWHPKFAVDLVPDIESAVLPEIPENKICTAKDVLDKVVKSSLRGKIVKALKCVSEESSTTDKKKDPEPTSSQQNVPQTKTALKGVCADLIAKIRARESAKLLESMIESPDETKRKAMMERLPKIIQILWHFFIAERKAAVPVDTAVEKIIHSCSSLSTHEEVKAHLTLITETFPGWLSFIQIPKGLYITINKNKNIMEMINKLKC